MVLDQIAKDLTAVQGPRTMKEGIVHDTGEMITQYVHMSPPEDCQGKEQLVRHP
jgi:hypothetical protein